MPTAPATASTHGPAIYGLRFTRDTDGWRVGETFWSTDRYRTRALADEVGDAACAVTGLLSHLPVDAQDALRSTGRIIVTPQPPAAPAGPLRASDVLSRELSARRMTVWDLLSPAQAVALDYALASGAIVSAGLVDPGRPHLTVNARALWSRAPLDALLAAGWFTPLANAEGDATSAWLFVDWPTRKAA